MPCTEIGHSPDLTVETQPAQSGDGGRYCLWRHPMNDYLWVIPTLLAVTAAGYMIYAISTRGQRGAMFGHKIAATEERAVEYRHRGAKHTIRIHRFTDVDLFGLEIGRWIGIFGETSPIVVPREQLLHLRDLISEFIDDGTEVDNQH